MKSNKGSTVIEASLVFPLFLFFALFLFYATRVSAVKAAVYEGCVGTAEYLAEAQYLNDRFDVPGEVDVLMASQKFKSYVEDKDLINRYVKGGMDGVQFLWSNLSCEDGYIYLNASYQIQFQVPFFSVFTVTVKERIKQRAYLGGYGDEAGGENTNEDIYVFITDNKEAYHKTRSCTYLQPNISASTVEAAKEKHLRPCAYCVEKRSNQLENCFVTKEGECYHYSRSCSRLRRTVYRKKLREVNLPPCSKCGGGHK